MQATSGKLAAFLAYSGSVVFLQKSDFIYHFSSRLEPWVHYVPVSYSLDDVVEKIVYLRNNDALAHRIAGFLSSLFLCIVLMTN